MQLFKILTDESLKELTVHGSSQFPFEFYSDDISKYETENIPRHWHNEFELVTVKEGTVYCFIGQMKLDLQTGDSIFINSRIIHSFETPDNGLIYNVVFKPEFLSEENTLIYDKYISPFLISDISHLVFSDQEPWQKNISLTLEKAYALCIDRPFGWELSVHAQLSLIWASLFTHKHLCSTMAVIGTSYLSQARVRKMVSYIAKNFDQKVTLRDIANSANLSRSEALRCFKDNVNASPVHYLNKYRLRIAANLLVSTDKKISDIATAVGIDNISYFNRIFKREFGDTPKKVREGKFGK